MKKRKTTEEIPRGCFHKKLEYLGQQKDQYENHLFDLYNCLVCHSTITLKNPNIVKRCFLKNAIPELAKIQQEVCSACLGYNPRCKNYSPTED